MLKISTLFPTLLEREREKKEKKKKMQKALLGRIK